MSGLYDMKAPRLSARSNYVKFDDDMEQSMSSLRQLDKLRAPITVTTARSNRRSFSDRAAISPRGEGRRQAGRTGGGAKLQPFRNVRELGQSLRPERTCGAQLMKLA